MSEPHILHPAASPVAQVRPGRAEAPRDRALLTVRGVSVGYAVTLLADVSLDLGAGEAVRVAGANAVGKSTLLRCVAGIQKPLTGWISICGHDLVTDPVAAKRCLGYDSGDLPFTYLTGREHLQLAARVYRLPRTAVDAVLERFPGWALTADLDTEVRRYSHGMRQQLAFLLSVIHVPRLLVLDESVSGFDDDSLADVLAFLGHHLAGDGGLVFVDHRDEVAARFPEHTVLRLGPSARPEGV